MELLAEINRQRLMQTEVAERTDVADICTAEWRNPLLTETLDTHLHFLPSMNLSTTPTPPVTSYGRISDWVCTTGPPSPSPPPTAPGLTPPTRPPPTNPSPTPAPTRLGFFSPGANPALPTPPIGWPPTPPPIRVPSSSPWWPAYPNPPTPGLPWTPEPPKTCSPCTPTRSMCLSFQIFSSMRRLSNR